MKKIYLLTCCHNKLPAILPPLFHPIQCGASLNSTVENAIPDNSGDNISEKNREYCELTAHYYAWKNIEADYYGFCHYRRFLCFEDGGAGKKPYLVFGKLKENKSYLLGTEEKIRSLCGEFDIIVTCAEDMGMSVREHYCTSEFHYAEDLESFIGILSGLEPHLAGCIDSYLSQQKQYFCNIFVMDKTHFLEYCEILFKALSQFDINKKKHGDFQSDRVDGYLGEIFTGIYITYARKNGAKVKELPRIDVDCTLSKRLLYRLLPPETKRRFAVKKAVKSVLKKLRYSERKRREDS